ncbi:hypothetical protein E2C01_102659 [Portunus trituberculatus]|uniref:Uncharacterized protein n=1 Tax=Portunus trituberculatus TaxID=210409 RepID=A0A5B7KNB3_PORTR|nr:hypothetical protein [Portunus trituberculatus]
MFTSSLNRYLAFTCPPALPSPRLTSPHLRVAPTKARLFGEHFTADLPLAARCCLPVFTKPRGSQSAFGVWLHRSTRQLLGSLLASSIRPAVLIGCFRPP